MASTAPIRRIDLPRTPAAWIGREIASFTLPQPDGSTHELRLQSAPTLLQPVSRSTVHGAGDATNIPDTSTRMDVPMIRRIGKSYSDAVSEAVQQSLSNYQLKGHGPTQTQAILRGEDRAFWLTSLGVNVRAQDLLTAWRGVANLPDVIQAADWNVAWTGATMLDQNGEPKQIGVNRLTDDVVAIVEDGAIVDFSRPADELPTGSAPAPVARPRRATAKA